MLHLSHVYCLTCECRSQKKIQTNICLKSAKVISNWNGRNAAFKLHTFHQHQNYWHPSRKIVKTYKIHTTQCFQFSTKAQKKKKKNPLKMSLKKIFALIHKAKVLTTLKNISNKFILITYYYSQQTLFCCLWPNRSIINSYIIHDHNDNSFQHYRQITNQVQEYMQWSVKQRAIINSCMWSTLTFFWISGSVRRCWWDTQDRTARVKAFLRATHKMKHLNYIKCHWNYNTQGNQQDNDHKSSKSTQKWFNLIKNEKLVHNEWFYICSCLLIFI